MHLIDGLSVKCILYKTFVFHQNLIKLGEVVVHALPSSIKFLRKTKKKSYL